MLNTLWILLVGCGSPGLAPDRLPVGTSTLPVPGAEAVVTVDTNGFQVDGASVDGPGAPRSNGMIPTVTAALKTRAEAIRARAASEPGAPGLRGAVSLEIDKDLPSDLLVVLVESAAAAGFGKPWLVVADRQGQRHGIRLALPEVTAEAAATERSDEAPVAGSWANPRITLDPDQGVRVRVHDRVVDGGDGLLLACDPKPCADSWPWVELSRVARRVKLDHPRDRAVMVTPDPRVPIQAFVTALDATRDDAVVSRGTRELFPIVQLVDDGSGR